MMRNTLDSVLSIFSCDRAFLLYPCDPEAVSWTVPVERFLPEFEDSFKPGMEVPMDREAARVFRMALDSGQALSFGAESDRLLPSGITEEFQINSLLAMALHPQMGKPWLFGVHQCSHSRVWSPEEEKLLQGIGRRLGDALSNLLMYRDLRRSEAFLNSIVENIPDTIFVKDSETLEYMRINRAGEELLGISREELVGKKAGDLLPEEQACAAIASDRKALDAKGLLDIPEEKIQPKGGDARVLHTKKIPLFDDDGKPRHLLVISEDITNLKKLQAQLNQTQRMEALGTMSGGIAHDFNNILQPMLGNCELLKERLPEDSELHTYLDGIYTPGLRARDLVQQILIFSRHSERKIISVNIQSVMEDAIKMGRSIVSSNIEILQDITEDCGAVLADPTQLRQIIMNLIINAWHAMEETGGEIVLRLGETDTGEGHMEDVSLAPGRYAVMTISDTGCGIDPAVMGKIFEPYVTTKPQGKGTGLGLAVVYGIVREHGGQISVSSRLGQGATFHVYLPLAGRDAEDLQTVVQKPTGIKGHERILFVDDEALIREMGIAMLEHDGYHVTACENGAEALKTFSADKMAFDLVITDMNMPSMTGDRLAAELMTIRPDVPIIICTGYSERLGRDDARALGIRAFVKKPVSLAVLSREVRRALDGENG